MTTATAISFALQSADFIGGAVVRGGMVVTRDPKAGRHNPTKGREVRR